MRNLSIDVRAPDLFGPSHAGPNNSPIGTNFISANAFQSRDKKPRGRAGHIVATAKAPQLPPDQV
jgi:hypothetical protein